MDATRSDVGFLCAVIEAAIRAGATTINIPDTVGYAIPSEFGELIRTLRQRVKGIEKVTLSVHCHNDLGLAVSNSLTAIQMECARWSAPLTELVKGRAIPLWKRSSWPSTPGRMCSLSYAS